MHPDIELVLGRYFVETTAAGIPFNLNDGKSVPGILANAGVGGKQAFFNELAVLF
jgi:hypothetical protein